MARKTKKKFFLPSDQPTYVSLKFYEEQLPDGWENTKILIKRQNKNEIVVVAIRHYKDEVEDEDSVFVTSEEKPHIHVIIKQIGHAKRLKLILEELGIVFREEDENLWKNHGCEPIEDWTNMVTYLPHLTDQARRDGKAEYSLDELVSNLSVNEIKDIIGSYTHQVQNNDLKALDKDAEMLGYSLKDFDEWYGNLDFEIRIKGAMRTIKESYERGIQKRIDEKNELLRVCIFIEGDGAVGKTYNSKKALEALKLKTFTTSDGTGKFDDLKPTHQAMIIDDDTCPNLLNVSDNYVCKVYKRNNGNPPWCGTFFVVTSNLSFDEWLKASGINGKHIEPMHQRFYICFVKNKKLVCSSKCVRGGTPEEINERDKMFMDFKEKFEESLSQYTPQTKNASVLNVNGNEELVYLCDKHIKDLKARNAFLEFNRPYNYKSEIEKNNMVINTLTYDKEFFSEELLYEEMAILYEDEFMENSYEDA